MRNKGEVIGLKVLITAVFGFAVALGISQMMPTFVDAVKNVTTVLGGLGVGGSIGALILSILVGLVAAIGLSKLVSNIFGIDLGI